MHKKEVFAWGTYDFANTIFSALFVTVFFPFYVKSFLGGTEFQIGLVFGLSMLAVGLVVPVIGAWSDALGRRMPFIIFFTIICCLFTYFVGQASLFYALVFGFIANFSYHAALTAYNALLPRIAGSRLGFVSGIGTAMGYLGTLISLGIASLVLYKYGWETEAGSQAVFAATSIMFFVFSLVMFFGVKEPPSHKRASILKSIGAVWKTLAHISKFRSFFLFLLAMFCFSNAINAAIVFLFLFAKQQINLSIQSFFVVYVLQSLGAVVGSYLSGRWVERYGSKKVLVGAGFAWIGVIVLLLFVSNLTMFIIAGMLGGAALGAVWTAQRPKLVELVSKAKVGQFFGFLELTDKFSGIIGPVVFGALATFVNYTAALLSLIVFFAAGLLFLRGVRK
ncbi:MAG: MFS transporter [Candidatus Woesearchaeota archaeon]|nr:MFS transporter [Candidatus Woesearchaeota archaeon]